ncbi:PilZ domain-containing protein [Catenovulum agarivorans]|uniref:PilZ domain-containing protein n=1 Tax=Catenovulum agarivorans TaxID=1172192 RepID=UPI0002E78AFC|nr:PilZ domain-containing protein [Catenovulum agarivorans]
MDFPAHLQNIVDKLSPAKTSATFEQLFKAQTKKLTNSERFLVKMEINRLNKACQRPIDLRGRHGSACQPYQVNGVQHYLPEPAIERLNQLLAIYKQIYCFAIYEQILFEYKQKPQAQTYDSKTQRSEIERTLMSPIEFGQRVIRNEERMHYTTQVTLNINKLKLDAITCDISPSGLRIKIKAEHRFESEQLLQVSFVKWQSKFSEQTCRATYKLCWQKLDGHNTLLGLAILPELDQFNFSVFIDKYVKSYRRKYKLDACNTLQSARNILFEQCYFYTHSALPLLLTRDSQGVHIPYVCKQSSNAYVLDYWQDEHGVCQLRQLFSGARLLNLLNQITPVKNEYLFCFTHVQQGKTHHFSATYDELVEADLLSLYLGFAAQKSSWRVLKIQLQEIDLKNAQRAVAIPESAGEEIAQQNQPVTPDVIAQLANLTHFALLIDVTNQYAKASYADHQVDTQQLESLMRFKQEKLATTQTQALHFQFLGKRKEPRVRYSSAIQLELTDSKVAGQTMNISTNGMQLKLKTWPQLERGQYVLVGFPELAKKLKLKGELIKYQVMGTNADNCLVGLRLVSGSSTLVQALGKIFDSRMEQAQSPASAALENAIRNIIVMSTSQCCGFIYRSEQKHLNMLAQPSTSNRLSALIDKCQNYQQKALESFILKRFEQSNFAINNSVFELVISVVNQHDIFADIWLDKVVDENSRKLIIQQQLALGQVWVVRLECHDAIEADWHAIELELSYLSAFQPAGAQQLQKYFSHIKHAYTLTDVTREVLVRYEFTAEQISHNHTHQNEFIFDIFD